MYVQGVQAARNSGEPAALSDLGSLDKYHWQQVHPKRRSGAGQPTSGISKYLMAANELPGALIGRIDFKGKKLVTQGGHVGRHKIRPSFEIKQYMARQSKIRVHDQKHRSKSPSSDLSSVQSNEEDPRGDWKGSQYVTFLDGKELGASQAAVQLRKSLLVKSAALRKRAHQIVGRYSPRQASRLQRHSLLLGDKAIIFDKRAEEGKKDVQTSDQTTQVIKVRNERSSSKQQRKHVVSIQPMQLHLVPVNTGGVHGITLPSCWSQWNNNPNVLTRNYSKTTDYDSMHTDAFREHTSTVVTPMAHRTYI